MSSHILPAGLLEPHYITPSSVYLIMASLLSGIDKVFNTLPTKFIWEYQNSNNTFEKFDRGATRKLEQAFKTNGIPFLSKLIRFCIQL